MLRIIFIIHIGGLMLINSFTDKVFSSTSLDAYFDAERSAYWVDIHGHSRPICDFELLTAFHSFFDGIKKEDLIPNFVVIYSSASKNFNLGGDFDMFSRCVSESDAVSLREYAHSCVEALHLLNSGVYDERGVHVPTIALVQNTALGGGFEIALSCDFIVAESHVKFGLPESAFNLFPGMGAYQFLMQKTGNPKLVEKLIISGKSHAAEYWESLNVVDILCESGDGVMTTIGLMDSLLPKHVCVSSLMRIRADYHPFDKQSLIKTTDEWVGATLQLSEENLKYITRLSSFQKNRN